MLEVLRGRKILSNFPLTKLKEWFSVNKIDIDNTICANVSTATSNKINIIKCTCGKLCDGIYYTNENIYLISNKRIVNICLKENDSCVWEIDKRMQDTNGVTCVLYNFLGLNEYIKMKPNFILKVTHLKYGSNYGITVYNNYEVTIHYRFINIDTLNVGDGIWEILNTHKGM